MSGPARSGWTAGRAARGLVPVIAVAGIGASAFFLLRDDLRADAEQPYAAELAPLEAASSERTLYREEAVIDLPLEEPRGIAVGADGRLYVAGDRRLLAYGPDGALVREAPLEAAPRCLAVDGAGGLFVGFQDHLEVYHGTLERSAVWTYLGERALITSVSAGREAVYVADAGNRAVLRFTPSGRLTRRFTGADRSGFLLPSPYFDVAVRDGGPGSKERVWVVNTGRHRLECYDPDGRRTASWGRPSTTVEGFCGCCNPVHIALLADGSFATAEKGLARVKIHDPDGLFVGVAAGPEQLGTSSPGLDLAVDGRDRLYVLDPAGRRVVVLGRRSQEAGE